MSDLMNHVTKGIEDKVVQLTEREMTLMEQLDQWLRELVFPGKVEDFIEEYGFSESDEETRRELCFYTDEYCYYIRTKVTNNGNNYLGCQVNARKKRPAENWVRGNDLPDGPFNKETWNKIIYAIVNYELIKLSPYQKPDEIPEDVA